MGMMHASDRLTFALLGTGALGGYYGSRLVAAGEEIHVLARSDAAVIRERGLTVVSGGTTETFRIPVYDRPEAMPRADVALVCIKSTQNDALPDLLPPVLKPEGVVVLLQNGLEEEAKAAAVVGEDRVYGGVCFLCANKTGPGTILHLDYGKIVLGRYTPDGAPGGLAPVMEAVAAAFERAGIPVTCTDHLRDARWRKLVWNIPYNGLSVVLQATTDALMGDPGLRREVAALMDEVRALAAGEGIAIPASFRDTMLDHTEAMQPYKTSMMLDYDRKTPLELQALYRDPLAAGQRQGVVAPRIAWLEAALTFLDRRNRG